MNMSIRIALVILCSFVFMVDSIAQTDMDRRRFADLVGKVPFEFQLSNEAYSEKAWFLFEVKDSTIVGFESYYVQNSRISKTLDSFFNVKLIGFKFSEPTPKTIIMPLFITKVNVDSNKNVPADSLFDSLNQLQVKNANALFFPLRLVLKSNRIKRVEVAQ